MGNILLRNVNGYPLTLAAHNMPDNNCLRKINYSKDDMKVNWIEINDIFFLISCIIWLRLTACLTFEIISNCIGTLESDDEVHTDLNRVR